MKQTILLMAVCLFSATLLHAQTWDDLSNEQKLMKLKSFRADNQKYMKDSLKLTQRQMTDVDNVNICYLSTLDRIDRYAKSDEVKQGYAEALFEVRWAQIDAIMGEENHMKYAQYLKRKIEKEIEKNNTKKM